MTKPIGIVSRASINYAVLCIGCLLAFPSGFAAVLLTLGLALPLTPWLIIDALKIQILQIPILLGGMAYVCLVLLTWRFQTSPSSAAKFSILSVGIAYVLFAVFAEQEWRSAMEEYATLNGLECIEAPSSIPSRLLQASPAFHSDERMFHTPHATASRGGEAYIWSFSETKFVLKPNAKGRC